MSHRYPYIVIGQFRAADSCGTHSHSVPAVTIAYVVRALGRHGPSVSRFDIEYVEILIGVGGRPAYGASPHDNHGEPLRGRRGRPLIVLSSLALQDMETAVTTIFHEVAHHRSYRATGHGGTEAAAEAYGQRMCQRFARRRS
jgi:hypothetical protein